MREPLTPFLFCYVLSGAAGLLYEIAWLRLLTLYFGHTVGAASTVLATVMGGLAAGAVAGGRFAARLAPARGLPAYSALEVATGALALVLPALLAALDPMLRWAYRDGNGGLLFGVGRAVAGALVLSAPAAAMGATFPVAVRVGVGRVAPGAWAARLYATNTIGAAAAALATGFVLLPRLGWRGTVLVGAGLNGLAASGALLLAASGIREQDARPAHGPSGATARRSPPVRGLGRPPSVPLAGGHGVVAPAWLAASAVIVSGFVALASEVVWTRLLALALGPTSYAFGAMLAAFVGGLAVGAWVAARLPARRSAGRGIGVAFLVAAAAILGAGWFVERLPLAMAEAVARPEAHFGGVLARQVLLAVVSLTPFAAALGLVCPLALTLVANQSERAPRAVATLYAVNTLAAVGGATAAGLVLIPALGLRGALQLLAAIAATAGVGAWALTTPRWPSRLGGAAIGALLLAGALRLPPWSRALLASGAYRYAADLEPGSARAVLETGRLLFYREGPTATVGVRERAGVRSLVLDGKVDASNGPDLLTEKLLAHLPLLLHPDPRRVLVIGLGSGVTVGAALRHPVRAVDVVEISPEVVEAARYFDRENHRALDDPRTRLIVGDGRSHLRLARTRYDVVISEPSNPWLAGMAALFTREFLTAARDRLAAGGVVCQWAHTYSISDRDLRSIVATFLSVFPDGTAWLVGEADLLLIGSTGPLSALERGVERQWARPGVAEDLLEVGLRDQFSVLSLFVAAGGDLRRYAGDAPVQTDDRLALEFSAPRALYGRFQASNVAALGRLAARSARPRAVQAAEATAGPREWRNRGAMLLRAEAFGAAYRDFARAVEAAPEEEETFDGLVRAAAGAARLEEAATWLFELGRRTRNVSALLAASTLRAAQNQWVDALVAADEARAVAPESVRVLEHFAALHADRGDVRALVSAVEALERRAPDSRPALYYRAWVAFLQGNAVEAAALAERLLARDPKDAKALSLLGGATAALRQLDRARRAFERAYALNPRDPALLANLGSLALRTARPREAAEWFAEALLLAPRFAAARRGLADALEALGEHRRAADLRAP